MEQSAVYLVPAPSGPPRPSPAKAVLAPADHFLELSDSDLDSESDCLTDAQLHSILNSKHSDTLLQQNAGRIKCTLIRRPLPNDLKHKLWKRLFLTPEFEAGFKKVKFERLATQKCLDDHQISKDIKRTKTAPNLSESATHLYREAVRAVLTAYANHSPSIGYVQGMNMSVSAILFNICSSFDQAPAFQEDAFKLFVAIMEYTQVGEYYKGNMEGIKGLINELKERIQTALPDVYWHFIFTDENVLMYFVNFFFAFGLHIIPLEFSEFVLNLVLLYGTDAILKLIVVILRRNRDEILATDKDTLMVVVSKVVLERALKDRLEFLAVLADLNSLLKFSELSFLRIGKSGK